MPLLCVFLRSAVPPLFGVRCSMLRKLFSLWRSRSFAAAAANAASFVAGQVVGIADAVFDMSTKVAKAPCSVDLCTA